MPTELNQLKPMSYLSLCFLPSPSAIYINQCNFLLFRSFILTPLDFCFIFQLLFWSLKHVLLQHKRKVPNPDGGNMAGRQNWWRKTSLIRRSLLERATHSAPPRLLLIYQTNSKGWAGSTGIWKLSFDYWAILCSLIHGSCQNPNS